MTSVIRNITFDTTGDPYDLAQFWSKILDRPLDEDDKPGDPMAALPAEGQPVVLFIQVPEGKTVKNRLHLDLQPTDRTRDEEVERVIGLGATLVDDQRNPDGTGWVVFADPEGNEFCVVRSKAERGQ